MDRLRDYSPRGRSMSISPEYSRASPDYRSKSPSRSPPHYRRNNHNGYNRSPNFHTPKKFHHFDYMDERPRNGGGSDYDSDREYNRREVIWEPPPDRRSRSRSPDYCRERDRSDRGERNSRHYRGNNRGERDSNRDHQYGSRSRSKRSRSASRWERRSEDRKMRERESSRSYRDEDRDSVDSERSPNGGAIIGASGSEIIGYKSQPPNNTIMIRGLAQHISENDIRQDIIHCGLMPKDIRLIRKKDTGTSRGFAFVEFSTLGEAVRWMDVKQGVLMLQDQYRAIMQYSIPKDICLSSEKPISHKASADWFCIKCGAQNFKRRDNCFKCHASRMESEEGGSGSDEICSYTTKTIMIRNLDALTTEDSVMSVLNSVIPELVKSVSAVCIGRDPLTSTSRGICYLGTESTIDALAIHGALSNLSNPLTIDGKTVILSYCKYNMGDNKKAYSQVDNAAFPNAAVPSTYAMTDVESLAEYAARRYAKTPAEYVHYIEYYRTYFTQQITAGNSITLHQESQMDAANAAAAVAQSAIQQMHAKTYYDNSHMAIPTGTDGKRYPIPDITKYTYDKATGYQYDGSTGLYYDPNSSYYWNSLIQKYLYWDQEKMTYALAPLMYDYTGQQTMVPGAMGQEQEAKKPKIEKQDKVKVAKKIAKDMERWAKTLNQKKEGLFARSNTDSMASSSGSASADIGFSVLEKKTANQLVPGYFKNDIVQEDTPVPPTAGVSAATAAQSAAAAAVAQAAAAMAAAAAAAAASSGPLVAAYGGESDSSGEDEQDEAELLDYAKLICNLCKRQLGSSEALNKHAKLSALHKQNLEARRKARKLEVANCKEKIVYRDRAKERRMKYGDPDEPQPSKLKEKYLKSRELASEPPTTAASVTEPIGSENVGNKLLQKMGWTEGQGLGKLNQGRTTIIQAEQHSSTVGLGNKVAGYTAIAGESYKDCVKKMMYARYQELSEKDT